MIEQHGIILFDGICNLCNRSVDFIIRKDKKDYFRFAPLQSEAGKLLLEKYHLSFYENESVILIESGKVYRKSAAACGVMKHLSGIWKILSWSIILPGFLRNGIYDFIARHRYHWFGKRNTCRIASPEEAGKFLS
ncbi:MAG: thiol-disulfide oxidoreductase DCC family protein [Chitinophagaceae bacterium]